LFSVILRSWCKADRSFDYAQDKPFDYAARDGLVAFMGGENTAKRARRRNS